MKRRSLVVLLSTTVLLALPATAYAGDYQVHRHHASAQQQDQGDDSGDSSGDDSGDDSSSDPSPDQVQPDDGSQDDMPQMDQGDPSTRAVAAHGPAQTIQVQTTSYSYGDNQGSNNATICCGVLHRTAGGNGTFTNPITLAVPGSGSSMQTPAGTKVYFKQYRFYGIVEDSGASPETLRRFDIWSDGRGLATESDCMSDLTGTSTAILNPPPGEPVGHVGPLADAAGCHVAGGAP